jgi:hypothetical protein
MTLSYWTVNWCIESWIQRSTGEGWETVRVFRGPGHEERAAEALREFDEDDEEVGVGA